MVKSILSGEDRNLRLDTKEHAIALLKRRKLTHNLKINIVKAFLAAYREASDGSNGGNGTDPRLGVVLLKGEGTAPVPPWSHQNRASNALKAYAIENSAEGALIVLPTGAGKTEIVAEWLLDRMKADERVRALWIVHQQELVDQAILRFATCAMAQPTNFQRRARAIHSGGSEIATLAEANLDLACITIQTLRGQCVKGKASSKLEKFLERPTDVVVDEAHHAASTSYSEVLDAIERCGRQTLIGLTATPWPAASGAYESLHKRFSRKLIDIGPEELIAERILARPVLHAVQTGISISLDSKEIQEAERSDFSQKTLRRLNASQRNQIVKRAWKDQREKWGKTLVFAVNIEHANQLTGLLVDAGADARTVHSKSGESRRETLQWFKSATNSPVLVSVGMLTEGVDLPDASTAFLARPTASRILLRQMIGRVLRGPKSGGSAEAQIVWFQDDWENFGEVLDPSIALPAVGDKNHPLLDDQTQEIPADVEAEIAALLAPRSPSVPVRTPEGWRTPEPLLLSTRLTGYYELIERRIPVFAHQEQGFNELIQSALSNPPRPAHLSWFEDSYQPYPSKQGLTQLVAQCKELGAAPLFVPLDAVVGPQVAAERIVAGGALTQADRNALIRDVYETSIARAAYRTLERFEEAVEQELRDRARNRGRIERPLPRSVDPKLKKRPRAERDLIARWHAMLLKAPALLTSDVRSRLADPPSVEVNWTRRVVITTWAHWSIKLSGQNAGRQVIRVNRLLKSTPEVVPDALLEYLLYHELLHHLLPGQGHDAEFYDLEAKWPDRDQLDLRLATFHEEWDTEPPHYENEVSSEFST